MKEINEKCKESGFFLTPVHVNLEKLTKESVNVRFTAEPKEPT